MAITLDLTLDGIQIPGLTTFSKIFGTKKADGVSLSVLEHNANILAPWNRQRPFIAGESATTGIVEAHATIAITGGHSITLGAGAFVGVSVTLINTTTAYLSLVTSALTGAILPYQIVTVIWDGEAWRVEDGDAPGTIKIASFPIDATHPAPYGFLDHSGYRVSRTSVAYKRPWAMWNVCPAWIFTCTTETPSLFTKSAHGFVGGERLRLFTSGTLTGAVLSQDSFVEYVSANTFYLLTQEEGTARLGITAQSGTHTYQRSLYGLGDGSTTFDTPDYRQCALVAAGTGSTHNIIAPDAFGLGQFKDDRVQGFRMNRNANAMNEIICNSGGGIYAFATTGGVGSIRNYTTTGDPVADPTNGTPRNGTTTRTKEIGTNYLIKL